VSILDGLGRPSVLMVVSLFEEEEDNCFLRLPRTILARNHKYQHLRSDRLAYWHT
jgi:hypothetical protein